MTNNNCTCNFKATFDLGKSGEGKRNDPLSFIWLKRNGGKK